jgi:xanthosine phosphorylase
MSDIEKSAKVIQNALPGFKAPIAVMLGSGLGAVADLLNEEASIPYTDLPGFPQPTVAGHEGSICLGNIDGAPVYFLKGRQHLYEGEGTDALKVMIRTLKTLGVNALFLTNAAGSLIKSYGPGSLVAIRDHINLTGTNPLAGANDDEWGPRFVDMSCAWSEELNKLLMKSADDAGISLGSGTYACFLGPTFETPAEITMAKAIGADLVGMSTVPENIIARHCGMECAGVSAVTNLAAGMADYDLSHEQTLEGAAMAEENMAKLVHLFVVSYNAKQKNEAA